MLHSSDKVAIIGRAGGSVARHGKGSVMASKLRIDRRFRGPPASGNGGYVAGLLARETGQYGCVVTLKAPPPLDTDLRIARTADGASLWSGDVLVAEAAVCDLDVAVPDPPIFADAAKAEARFTGLHDHVFPGCFVCGPDRAPGDGLRIFPGAVGGPGPARVASCWQPGADLADSGGEVSSEFVWAALDCPGFFAVEAAGPAVLGRIAVARKQVIRAGEPLIVTGWPIESTGRKHHVGTALHSRDGALLAVAKATWIAIDAAHWRA